MFVDTAKVLRETDGSVGGMLSSSYDVCLKADRKVVAPNLHLKRTGEPVRSPKTISVSQIEDNGEKKYRARFTN